MALRPRRDADEPDEPDGPADVDLELVALVLIDARSRILGLLGELDDAVSHLDRLVETDDIVTIGGYDTLRKIESSSGEMSRVANEAALRWRDWFHQGDAQ